MMSIIGVSVTNFIKETAFRFASDSTAVTVFSVMVDPLCFTTAKRAGQQDVPGTLVFIGVGRSLRPGTMCCTVGYGLVVFTHSVASFRFFVPDDEHKRYADSVSTSVVLLCSLLFECKFRRAIVVT